MNNVEISSLAEGYAEKFNPGNLAPFPYENVVKEYSDLEVLYLELEDNLVSGATLFEKGAFTVIVNTNKSANRQHFTLAHELGHYFLHKDILRSDGGLIDQDQQLDATKILYRLDDKGYEKLEREANRFAASLIMPRRLVIDAWNATHTIEDCARIFQVSTIAMSIRLDELGLEAS